MFKVKGLFCMDKYVAPYGRLASLSGKGAGWRVSWYPWSVFLANGAGTYLHERGWVLTNAICSLRMTGLLERQGCGGGGLFG